MTLLSQAVKVADTRSMTPELVVRTDRRRRRWPVLPRSLASLVLVAFGSLSTAFAAILVEEVVPLVDGNPWSISWTENNLRWVGFVLSIAITLWAVASLRVHRRRRGTLYYLRLLNETAPDLHRETVEKASGQYLGYRSIAAWCDPGPGTVDVRDQVAELSAELQRATNDDSNDSGYDIAPNLVFPAALAAGYDWTPPQQVILREINQPGRDPEFEWRLACGSASGQGCEQARDRHHRVPHFHADQTGQPQVISAWTQVKRPTGAVASVWLELRFSPRDWDVRSPHRDDADVQRTVGVVSRGAAGQIRSMAQLSYRPGRGAMTGLTALQVAEGAAYWVGRTLRDFPDATVFVAGLMPKTLSFAVGHLLTQPAPSGTAAHLWRRIVPMGHFLGEEPEMRPMWVRHGQHHPDELIAALAPEPAPWWQRALSGTRGN